EGYSMDADLTFATSSGLEGFSSPNLFQAPNTPNGTVLVPLGPAVKDVGDTFVFDPGKVQGSVFLLGPPEIGGAKSYLRQTKSVTPWMTGGDEPLGAFNETTIGGYAFVGSAGNFALATHAWEGAYQLFLGGLHQQPGNWARSSLVLTIVDKTDQNSAGFPQTY